MKNEYLEMFKALSDATRQEILEVLLEQEECSVSELCESFENMTQPTISHHLQILKRSQLVICHRRGKMSYYSVSVSTMRNNISDFFEKFDQ